MHMRKKEWARNLLLSTPLYCPDPAALRGQWQTVFDTVRPLTLELGCGKAVATARMAREHPEENYLLADISHDILGVACRNILEKNGGCVPGNIRVTCFDISYIAKFLAPEDRVVRILISFCNPWDVPPRYHKRRLTHPRQLMQYREFLTENGKVLFKTDDAPLFRDSLAYFAASGFAVEYLTEDLHASGYQPNYETEHERMYAGKGIPIRFGIFRKDRAPEDAEALLGRGFGAL